MGIADHDATTLGSKMRCTTNRTFSESGRCQDEANCQKVSQGPLLVVGVAWPEAVFMLVL